MFYFKQGSGLGSLVLKSHVSSSKGRCRLKLQAQEVTRQHSFYLKTCRGLSKVLYPKGPLWGYHKMTVFTANYGNPRGYLNKKLLVHLF